MSSRAWWPQSLFKIALRAYAIALVKGQPSQIAKHPGFAGSSALSTGREEQPAQVGLARAILIR